MPTTYRPYHPDQSFLLPPSPKDWLPEDHLAYFMADAIDALDLSAFHARYEGDGRRNQPFDPAMMVKVLVYGYATGVVSSRQIAKHLAEDVAFRVLAADNAPAHRTLREFRQLHGIELTQLFVQVVRLAAEAGYASEANFVGLEAQGQTACVALGREGKRRRLVDPQTHPATRRMAEHLATEPGQADYRRRKVIPEPVFGWIKHVLGFRRLSMRGVTAARNEWNLVCLATNLRRMHRLGWQPG